MGVLVPVLYFGMQLTAAPFYPGYSFVSNVASELGSDKAQYSSIFNMGIMATGTCAISAAVGFALLLHKLGRTAIGILLPAALTLIGIQSIWAGYFPMPDPRHGGHPLFIIRMITMPFLVSIALWREASKALRIYLVLSMLLLLCMVPIMTGLIHTDREALKGLHQRLLTLAIFPPIGVAAVVLSRRLGTEQRQANAR